MKNSILFQGLAAASVVLAAPAYAQSENVAVPSVRIPGPTQPSIDSLCTTIKLKRPLFSQAYYLQETDMKCIEKKQYPIMEKCRAIFSEALKNGADLGSDRLWSCLDEESQKAYGVNFAFHFKVPQPIIAQP